MSRRTTERRPSLPPFDVDHWIARRLYWQRLFQAVDKAVTARINRPRIGDVRPHPVPAVFKPRDHFRMDGQPKRPRTLGDAQRFCVDKPDARFYRCPWCQTYHVGHKKIAA